MILNDERSEEAMRILEAGNREVNEKMQEGCEDPDVMLAEVKDMASNIVAQIAEVFCDQFNEDLNRRVDTYGLTPQEAALELLSWQVSLLFAHKLVENS